MNRPIPPNVNGLIHFLQDISTHYTIEEQNNISNSDAGQQIHYAYTKCSGHAQQLYNSKMKLKNYIKDYDRFINDVKVSDATDTTSYTTRQQQLHERKNIIMGIQQDIQKLEMTYRSCLSYMICPIVYQQYTKCWDDTVVYKLPHHKIQEYKENGKLYLQCQAEREAIEYCIGSIVSNAVLAGTTNTTN